MKKDGDSKCFKMCSFRGRYHVRICNNIQSTVVFLSISQTGTPLDTGKVWPADPIQLIALTYELPAMYELSSW